MLALVERMRKLDAEEIAESARTRDELTDRVRATEAGARARADKFAPGSTGRDLVRELRELGVADLHNGATPPISSLEQAETRWRDLRAFAQRQAIDLRRAEAAWQAKLIKREKSRPRVDQELWDAARELAGIDDATPALRAKHVADEVRRLEPLRDRAAAEVQQRAAKLTAAIGDGRRALAALDGGLPLSARPWDAPDWAGCSPASRTGGAIRLGTVDPGLPARFEVDALPALLEFPFERGLVVEADVARRAAALAFVRSAILRILAVSAPGDTRFVFIDPVSLGQSVAELRHLAEYDQQVVDIKTWTAAADIERRLAEMSSHLETVISKYLRGQFGSIDEYNQHAGEVSEPYQVLVVFDYPQTFSDAAAAQLLSLIENGPRCGVHTILLTDPSREGPRDAPVARLTHSMNKVSWEGDGAKLTLAGGRALAPNSFTPDVAPHITFAADGDPTSPVARLLTLIGKGCRASSSGPVTLARLLPVLNRQIVRGHATTLPDLAADAPALDANESSTWWTGSTAEGASATIGRAGAQDVASLYFSSTEVAGGAMMIGIPRSGKSTALHAAIVTLAMTYAPEELELFLIDSKHGVEFKAYDDLPHARMVSINSEREFAASVLKSLDNTIADRAGRMKRYVTGSANLTEYRRVSGEVLPRIVLFMDEFHEVFEEDDALGQQAFAAFSNIVRQGPFAGVHIVVASQTLSSMPAMDRSTLALLPTRVAFMCGDSDADFVMGESNREVRNLSQQGSGILNPLRGDAAYNKPFQGVFIEPGLRTEILRQVREKADHRLFMRRPRVFDGDVQARRPTPTEIAWAGRETPNVPLGEPFSMEETDDVVLTRRAGSNVLIIGVTESEGPPRDRDLAAQGAMHSFLACGVRHGMKVSCIDFLGPEQDPGTELSVEDVCRAIGVSYHRARQAAKVLDDAAAEVRRRQDAEDYHSAGELLILHGLQRATDLAPWDPYSGDEDPDSTPNPARGLITLLRDGPDVGVHTVVSVDTLALLDRRMGRELLAEFELRLAVSAATAADVATLTDSYKERPPGPRQLLICDHARGTTRRVRSYSPLDESSAVELVKG